MFQGYETETFLASFYTLHLYLDRLKKFLCSHSKQKLHGNLGILRKPNINKQSKVKLWGYIFNISFKSQEHKRDKMRLNKFASTQNFNTSSLNDFYSNCNKKNLNSYENLASLSIFKTLCIC
jgi:hypothetical protein